MKGRAHHKGMDEYTSFGPRDRVRPKLGERWDGAIALLSMLPTSEAFQVKRLPTVLPPTAPDTRYSHPF